MNRTAEEIEAAAYEIMETCFGHWALQSEGLKNECREAARRALEAADKVPVEV
jgi:hypothetical protein